MSTPTEPNGADRELAVKLVDGFKPYSSEAVAERIAAHRASAVAEAVAELEAERNKLGMSVEDWKQQTSIAESERDSLKQAVAGLEASWKEKCIEADTMRQHHKNAESERDRLLVQVENQASIIRDTATPANERELRMLDELYSLRALVVRMRGFLEECSVAEDRSNLDGDSAEVVLVQINEGADELLKLVPESLRDCVVVKRGEWEAMQKDKERLLKNCALVVYRDGDSWCVTRPDFVNLQESPAWFNEVLWRAFDAAMNNAYTPKERFIIGALRNPEALSKGGDVMQPDGTGGVIPLTMGQTVPPNDTKSAGGTTSPEAKGGAK